MKRTMITVLIAVFLGLNVQIFANENTVKVTITEGLYNPNLKTVMEKNTSELLTLFNATAASQQRKIKVSNSIITKEAKAVLEELWSTSPMTCAISNIDEKCLTKSTGGYQIRNIPVILLAAPEDFSKMDMVLNFSADGKIDDIFIAIDAHQYTEIIDSNISTDDFNSRQQIIDVVENFRTAYNRKDIKFLENIFSNNALIITGKVITQKPNSDDALRALGTEKVVYQTQTKGEYLTSLGKVFARNEYINVLFEEVDVVVHPKYKDIYGVTLKQKWNSTTYSDVGFVFLMIDFQDKKNPMIHVRTWQPEKYNNQLLSRDEIFNLGSFGEVIR